MNPTTKTVISAAIALLSTYSATAVVTPDGGGGFDVAAGVGAVVAALNAISNLFVKKPTKG